MTSPTITMPDKRDLLFQLVHDIDRRWGEEKDMVPQEDALGSLKGDLNRAQNEMVENVRANIQRPLPQAKFYEVNDQVISIACGGPSLADTFDDLKMKYDAGQKVIAVNGTHNWLVERGVNPSVHVVLDARKENVGFVAKPIPSCKYFLASQCDPSMFEALKDNQVFIFHADLDPEEFLSALEEYYLGRYYLIPGGTTVTIRTIMLLTMLGFRWMEMYGFDSCWMDKQHHAYPQAMNDRDGRGRIVVEGREFRVAGWHVRQAKDFMELVKALGEVSGFNLTVHGDGLIAYLIATGAKLQWEIDAEEKPAAEVREGSVFNPPVEMQRVDVDEKVGNT
jgi:hypothetical protein